MGDGRLRPGRRRDPRLALDFVRTRRSISKSLARRKCSIACSSESFQKRSRPSRAMRSPSRATPTRRPTTVFEQIAAKLDTTREQGLRDLTGGGIVLAVEAEPGRKASTPPDRDAEGPGAPRPGQRGAPRAWRGRMRRTRASPIPSRPASIAGSRPTASTRGPMRSSTGKLVIADRGEALKAAIDRALDGPRPGLRSPTTPSGRSGAIGWVPMRSPGASSGSTACGSSTPRSSRSRPATPAPADLALRLLARGAPEGRLGLGGLDLDRRRPGRGS